MQVKTSDLLQFVREQDDARPINFNQPSSYYDCGCLMVHFAKEKLDLSKITCGVRMIYDDSNEGTGTTSLESELSTLLGIEWDNLIKIKTYGELKKQIT